MINYSNKLFVGMLFIWFNISLFYYLFIVWFSYLYPKKLWMCCMGFEQTKIVAKITFFGFSGGGGDLKFYDSLHNFLWNTLGTVYAKSIKESLMFLWLPYSPYNMIVARLVRVGPQFIGQQVEPTCSKTEFVWSGYTFVTSHTLLASKTRSE